jgi:hypothetical protein
LLLDASTSYTMGETGSRVHAAGDARTIDVPRRIFELRPDAKFIYIVRDPAARTFSAYWHDVRERREQRSLRRVIADDPAYLDPGFYFAQISRYLKYFDLDRFLFLRFESFVRDPVGHAEQCAEFLGVAPFAFRVEPPRNESFRYNWFGRLTRDMIGVDGLKRLSAGCRTLLPEPVYRSLKAVVARPLPVLDEADRAWLRSLFQEDYAAFGELAARRQSAATQTEPMVAAQPPIAAASTHAGN